MATFRSGPRDPVTGQSSARISSDNVVRSDGYTDRERAEISITPEDPRRQNQRVTPKGALSFQDFLSATGRSDQDPYGSSRGTIASGLSKLGTLDYRNNLSSGIINALNQQAYNKYINPQPDGQMQSFRPGDLAFIDGRTQRAVRAPSTAEGIMRFMPTARMLQGLFNPSVQFEPIGQGPATRGSRRPPSALEPTSAPQPGEVAPVVGDIQSSGFILASTMPREDNGIFNLPFSLDDLRTIPESGIGEYIQQGRDGFPIGPGKLKPEFNVNNGSFGLTFQIPIAANPNFSLPPNPKTETDAEFEARYDRRRAYIDRKVDQLRNEGLMEDYLAGQSDVGVYTPPRPPTTYQESMTLLPDLRESQQQQYGGFADPLVGGTLSDMLNRQAQEQRLNNTPLPNTYSPRRIAREALLSGRRFQQI